MKKIGMLLGLLALSLCFSLSLAATEAPTPCETHTYGTPGTHTCTVCGATDGHSYQYDTDAQHKCICGAIGEHDGTATCTAQAHCSICDRDYGTMSEHAYTGSAYTQINDTHYRFCDYGCGTTETAAPCGGGTASCTEKADCATCGKPYGEMLKHVYTGSAYTQINDTHYRFCDYGCGTTEAAAPCGGGTASCTEKAICGTCNRSYGVTLPHAFESFDVDKSTASQYTNYVKTAATCTTDGIYYQKCAVCGEKGAETFTAANTALGHDFASSSYQWSASRHWRKCARANCSVQEEPSACLSTGDNAATCTKEGYCNTCHHKISEPLGHHLQEVAETAYRISVATCTAKAKYYKSCSRCALSSKDCGLAEAHADYDFAYGETEPHTFEYASHRHDHEENGTTLPDGTAIANSDSHWCKCENCDAVAHMTAHSFHEKPDAVYLATPANCENNAFYYKSCSLCGWKGTERFQSADEADKALGHDFGNPNATEDSQKPRYAHDSAGHWTTCLRDGCGKVGTKVSHTGGTASCSAKASCAVCGASYGEATRHTFESYEPNLPHETTYLKSDATCTEAAVYYKRCTVCGKQGEESDIFSYGDPKGHEYADTLTSDGTHHWYPCTRKDCTAVKSKEAHKGGTADCSEKARCESCGTMYGEFAEHTYEQRAERAYLITAPTCTEKGIYYVSCSACHARGTATFRAGEPAHSYEAGYRFSESAHWHACRNCTVRQDEVLHVYDHDCDATCNVCTYSRTVTHDFGEYEPTGNTHHKRVCKVVKCRYEEISRHNWDEDEEQVTPSTETEPGIRISKCTDCGHSVEQEIEPAHEHKFSRSYFSNTERHWQECICGEKQNHETHTWDEGEILVEATCLVIGSTRYTCTACGRVKTIARDDVAHQFSWLTTMEPTCTEDGAANYACTSCGIIANTKILPPLGHQEGELQTVKEASCLENGFKESFCTRCGTSVRVDPSPALGHDFSPWKIHDAKMHHACARCQFEESVAIGADGRQTLQNDAVGISVEFQSGAAFANGTILQVRTLDAGEITKQIGAALGKKERLAAVYDLSLTYFAQEVSPGGMLLVTLPAPERQARYSSFRVIYLTEDNTLQSCETIYDEVLGILLFETDHFSRYAVIEYETNPMLEFSIELPDGVEPWMIGAGAGALALLIFLIILLAKRIRKKKSVW